MEGGLEKHSSSGWSDGYHDDGGGSRIFGFPGGEDPLAMLSVSSQGDAGAS